MRRSQVRFLSAPPFQFLVSLRINLDDRSCGVDFNRRQPQLSDAPQTKTAGQKQMLKMKSSGPLKHFIFAFIIAIVLYAVFFYGIEHRRAVNGPWQVTFTNSPIGVPELIVSQPKLEVSNLKIDFPDDKMPLTNSNGRLIFDTPKEVPLSVPFGQCIFMDTTFLPGTVTFNLFGHEIELLPRVLIINKKEYPWRSDTTISLSGTNRDTPVTNPVR